MMQVKARSFDNPSVINSVCQLTHSYSETKTQRETGAPYERFCLSSTQEWVCLTTCNIPAALIQNLPPPQGVFSWIDRSGSSQNIFHSLKTLKVIAMGLEYFLVIDTKLGDFTCKSGFPAFLEKVDELTTLDPPPLLPIDN